jgi:riboflavin transporter FmnP
LLPVLLALAVGTLVTACENIGIVDFQRELAFDKEFRLRVTGRVVGMILAPASIAGVLFLAEGNTRLNFHLEAIATCLKIPLSVAFVLVFGLKGAAVAVILAVAVQQLLFLLAVSRRTGSGIGEILRETWRPFVATAAILAACGLGWGQHTGGTVAAVRTLLVACPAGALLYTVTLLGIWFAQGRPEGAERDMLRLLGKWYRPVLPARFARPPVDLG